MSPLPAQDVPLVTIEASRTWAILPIGEIWRYRELAYFLTLRDIKVRYKQTFLGVLWALIQPTLLMLIFTVVFSNLVRLPSDNVPYPVFAYAGLLPWQLFAFALLESSGSLIANERLISKVYFPRVIIPASSVFAGFVDFAIALVLLIVLIVALSVPLAPSFVLAPLFVLLGFLVAAGVGLILSALNVRFRDVRYAVPFLTQLWFFATPIAYPVALLGEPYRSIVGLNPMTGVVEGFRWSLFGGPPPSWSLLLTTVFVAVSLLVGGSLYFHRVEREFADII